MKKLFTLFGLLLLPLTTSAATADTELKIQQDLLNTNALTISIQIENPSQQDISSVQSWLKFDPKVLKGIKINADQSPLDFVAPGENTFDNTQGLVKIGRSSVSGGVNTAQIFVAQIEFTRISEASTTISFYNFSLNNDGNTSVRVFEEGFPVNVLKEKPQNFVISGSNTPAKTPEIITPPVTLVEQAKGLKITSGPEYIILQWDKQNDVQGYNIYYSNQSGRYLQRRAVGNVNEYYLEGLQTGEFYYFAITAYDSSKKESEYSKEVRVKVGYPNTSSSPLLLTNSQAILNKTTKNVESGPASLALLALVFAGFGAFLFRRKV